MSNRPSPYLLAMGSLAPYVLSCFLLAISPSVCGQQDATGQAAATERQAALAGGRAHGREGAQYERARNYRIAMQEYQRAVSELADYAERSAIAAGRSTLPSGVYWTLGSARLDWARAWVLSGLKDASINEQAKYAANLASAKQDLLAALQVSASETPGSADMPPVPSWKIHSALAWHAILDGDAATARTQAKQADDLNPDNPYAASLDRAINALVSAGNNAAIVAERGPSRLQPILSEEVLASLKSVIEVGNFLAAAGPAFAVDVAMRGAPAASPRAQCPAAFTGTCYPVWFGTNRKPIDPADPSKGFTGEYDEQMRFGKRIVFIPQSHRPGELGSPLWKRLLTASDDRIEVGPSKNLSEQAFGQEIRDFLSHLNPDDRNVLVFIHGFNTSFDEATRRAAQLGFDLKVPGITAFYSWPSRGSTSDYVADLESIESSEEHIAQFLVKAAALADRGHVHIIAHSMGNRGLLRAMYRATAQAAIRSGVRFGKIFLAAPDVDAKLFRQLASIYPQISERTTLYVADQDRALAAMEWFSKEPRAGSVPPLVVVPGIDTIRVRGASLFRLGHSYVAEDINVIRDISTLLYGRDPPERRRERNGWPIPDRTPEGRGTWVIGN